MFILLCIYLNFGAKIVAVRPSFGAKIQIGFCPMRNKEWLELSNFSMGTISGMGFAQAQVHTVHSTSFESFFGSLMILYFLTFPADF